MSAITAYQNGQSDLELAPMDCAVLLAPYVGTSPVTNLEATGGGLDDAKLANFLSVGNFTKKDGVKLSNSPTINDIKSHGKGSPTRQLASESAKGITFVPQELTAMNIQNYWGIPASAFGAPSTHGGITVAIPDLPYNLNWRAILLAWDNFNGEDVFIYWLANKVSIGKRTDQSIVDSNVLEHGVDLTFLNDNQVGSPIIFGVCGAGWDSLNSVNDTGFYPPVTSITMSPLTATMTVAPGVGHTKQLTVTDSNTVDRTVAATYVSSSPSIATVSTGGLITAVSAGTTNVTASYDGFTAVCAVTAS